MIVVTLKYVLILLRADNNAPTMPRNMTGSVLRFGFMETPNVPKALAVARKRGLHFDIMSTSFFLSRRSLRPQAHSGIPRWQDRLFIALAHSAMPPTSSKYRPAGWWKWELR